MRRSQFPRYFRATACVAAGVGRDMPRAHARTALSDAIELDRQEPSTMKTDQKRSRARMLVVVLGIAGTAGLLAAQGVRGEVEQIVRSSGFAATDMAKLDAGEVLASAATPDREDEVVTNGAVKIRASREQVLGYYGQMISYVDGKVTLAFGRFNTPPALNDVQGLSLDKADVDELKSCRPGDCDLRIGSNGLTQARSAVNWNAPDPVAEANRYFRQSAVAYVADYQKRGDAALVTYNDRAEAVNLREQWSGILASSQRLKQYAPELASYLSRYPADRPAGVRDMFYWVKENYGLKPTISLVHGVIYEPPGKPDRVVVVQKQLYASHYFDGSLAVAVILSGTEGGAPASYLLYGNRSRGDLLKGGFGGLRRSVASRQVESATKQTLGTIKQVLEKTPPR